jgi:hypothetical protein
VGSARVVDEHLTVVDGIAEAPNRFVVSDVERKRLCTERSSNRVEPIGAAGAEDETEPLGREAVGRGGADATRRAGHHRRPPFHAARR